MSEETTNDIIFERLNNFIKQNSSEHEQMNGHLAKLNGSVVNLKVWKGIMQGGIAVLIAIIIPILFMFLSSYLDR